MVAAFGEEKFDGFFSSSGLTPIGVPRSPFLLALSLLIASYSRRRLASWSEFFAREWLVCALLDLFSTRSHRVAIAIMSYTDLLLSRMD